MQPSPSPTCQHPSLCLKSPVLVAVEVTDAEPRYWMFQATDTSLRIEPGQVAGCDVRIVDTVRAWRDLIYRRKTTDQLIAEGSATVEDPDGLRPSFLGSLATLEPPVPATARLRA